MSTAAPRSTDNAGVVALPPVLYLTGFLAALVLHWLWPLRMFVGWAGVWAGVALLALGFSIARWGRRTMTAAGTNVNPMRPVTAIVTSGPFRYSRNPLYVGLNLFYVGLVLAANTWWGIAMLVPLLLLLHFGVVLREERYLERKFGDSYRQYRSSVRRYV